MFRRLVEMFATQSRRTLLLATVVLAVTAFAAEDQRLDRLYRSSGSCTRVAVVDFRACTLVAQPGAAAKCEDEFETRMEFCGDAYSLRPAAGQEILPLKDARLKIELNATDKDAGVQVFLDADPWQSMDIYDPHGVRIFRSVTRGRLGRQGGTELFLESAEPNFSELTLEKFLERFPEGEYQFVGLSLDGEKMGGTAKFTHNLPEAPVLVAPARNAVVDRNSALTVQWRPVPPPKGSPIIGYQVLVVKPDTRITALPKIILDVLMPPTATSMAVPPGFLLANSQYEWEVIAIEESGNQTLSVGVFRTMP
jgi:hypothetical protein